MSWLSSSGRGMSFRGFDGEHGASERAQSVELPKVFWGADFDQIQASTLFDVIVRTACFVLWAMQNRCLAGTCETFETQALSPRWYRLHVSTLYLYYTTLGVLVLTTQLPHARLAVKPIFSRNTCENRFRKIKSVYAPYRPDEHIPRFVRFERKTRILIRILGRPPKNRETGMGGATQIKIAAKWAFIKYCCMRLKRNKTHTGKDGALLVTRRVPSAREGILFTVTPGDNAGRRIENEKKEG